MLSKATVKYIQSLQHKKLRDEEGLFVAEGPKLVEELLDGKTFTCRNVYALKSWTNPTNASAEIIGDFELEKISSLTTPNQVLAVFEKKKANENPSIKNKISLALDDIQDPGNLGTIIRIADWFGVENIFCSLHTADMYNSKVVQSTMASLQRINLVYRNLAEWLQQQEDIETFGATLHGNSLQCVSKLQEGIIIIGNESKGISPELMQLVKRKITIDKFGAAESLNAAVATSIILYEIKR